MHGQYIPNFPDFKSYDPASNQWTFDWRRWFTALKKNPTKTIEDPESYAILADKKDLFIVKELEKNAQQNVADIAPLLGISLQGVKYHYDKKLVPSEIVKYYGFNVCALSEEVSAYHEILLKFTSSEEMNSFFTSVDKLFFVLGVSKLLHHNALMVRTYMLQSQVSSLFAFISQMANEGILESYSAVRQHFQRQRNTINILRALQPRKGIDFRLG